MILNKKLSALPILYVILILGCSGRTENEAVKSEPSKKRPNIIFIMTDDHASHAMSCYGSRINETPNLDRIAEGGMRFNNCFCTNSINLVDTNV